MVRASRFQVLLLLGVRGLKVEGFKLSALMLSCSWCPLCHVLFCCGLEGLVSRGGFFFEV